MNILFLMADGFEELEFVAPFDYFQRGGLSVTLASISNKLEVVGSHGLPIKANVLLNGLDLSKFDGVLLPGGGLGVQNLLNSKAVEETVCYFNDENKWVFAICAAPKVLSKAGILMDRKFTCYPSCEQGLMYREFSEDRVVVDGNFVTSRGAGTAEEFALICLAQMMGDAVSEKVRQQTVAR